MASRDIYPYDALNQRASANYNKGRMDRCLGWPVECPASLYML